jgi:HSP20 family protein
MRVCNESICLELNTEKKERAMSAVKEAPVSKTNAPGQTREIVPPAGMPLGTRYASPFGLMRTLAEEMDRVFEGFGFEPRLRLPSFFTRGHELAQPETWMVPAEWAPRTEVFERAGQYVVRAELPGMTKDEVSVEIKEGMLTLQGERKQQKKEEREGYRYSECRYGRFYRAVPLPEGVEYAKATAEFKDGVLEVTMPAAPRPEQKTLRLEVREGK